jgi:hypothetical protein
MDPHITSWGNSLMASLSSAMSLLFAAVPRILGLLVILGIGWLVAVNQVGIASSLVTILFMAVVGALALALGLSFGLGGRDTAGTIVRQIYERNRRSGAITGGPSLGTQGTPSRVGYTGVEHRHIEDRRSNTNGRRAMG